MGWKEITELATKTQLRAFGIDVIVSFDGYEDVKSKAIISNHMESHRHSDVDVEGYAIVCSMAKTDVKDPQSVVGVFYNGKKRGVLRYKDEPDGYYVFFLSE